MYKQAQKIGKARTNRQAGITPLIVLIVVAFSSISVAAGSNFLETIGFQKLFDTSKSNLKSFIYSQPDYLDASKVESSVFDPSVVGTVNLADGSYSAYRIIDARVGGENEDAFESEAKIEFLSGDRGLGLYQDGIIVPFYLTDGTKTVGSVIDRVIVRLRHGNNLYPIKIYKGKVENGRLVGEFVGQTYNTGYIISGNVDEGGNIVDVNVDSGAARKSDESTSVAENALSLFNKVAEAETIKVLGASTLGVSSSYQVVGTSKPAFDPKTGRWAFPTKASTAPAQNLANYLQNLNQTSPVSQQISGASPVTTNTVYEYLPTYLQGSTTTIVSGIKEIKSSISNLKVSTVNGVATLSIDFPTTSTTTTTATIGDNSITGGKIQPYAVTANNLAQQLYFSPYQLLDLSAVSYSSTIPQGFRLPMVGTNPINPYYGKGYLAYDAINNQVIQYNGSAWTPVGGGSTLGLSTASGSGTFSTYSNSGLEINSNQLSLLRGCANGEILKWNNSSRLWQCSLDAGASGTGIGIVQEGDTTVVSNANILDLSAGDFTVLEGPTGEANVAIDYTNSNIVRSNQTQSITGNWTFSNGLTLGADNITDINGSGLSLVAGVLKVAGLTTTNFASPYISQFTNNAGYITGLSWGGITGTLANQTDLQTVLNTKANSSSLGTAAFTASSDYLTPSGSAASLTNFPTFNQNTTGTASNITGVLGASSFPALTGNVTTEQGSLIATVSGLTVSNFTSNNISQWNNNSGYITGLSWGQINGTLSNQTDLNTALGLKVNISSLGTAAYTAATDYATAVQGTLATNALPSASFTDAAVSGKLLTGYISGAGTVAATDSILAAIQKLNGNDATNANLTGVVTSIGNATAIANGAISNAMLANGAVANLSGTNTGDNAVNSNYSSDYRAANFVAGTNYLTPSGSAASLTNFPTFNQNTSGTASNITGVLGASSFPALTGDITNTQGSLSTAIANGAVTLAKMANMATASFIGRNTALTGAPEILSATTAKSILGITTSDVSGLGTIATQASNNVSITGGSMSGLTSVAATTFTGALTGNASTVTGFSPTTGKVLTLSNSLTLAGTDSSTLNIGTGGILGTAAFTASGAYATSAQGTLATNALPSASFTDAGVSGKLLTGYVSGAGTVVATDSILSAIQKLNGNDATNANLTGVVTSIGNATAIANSAITNAMLANSAVANLSGTNSGDNAVNSNYASDYRAVNFIAGTNYLAPSGSGASLTGITGDQVLPTQTGNNGKVLGTNGATVSWVTNSSGVAWGAITGTLANQTDLNTALGLKYDSTNFVAGTNYLTPSGSAASLTNFPTFNQNTTGTAAGLSVILASTSGGSGINNAGTLTWGAGGTLGTAAYTASGAYATSAQGTLATNALPSASFTDSGVSGKLLTGYVSGAGTVAATDSILAAIQKLNGNEILDYDSSNFIAGTNYLTPSGSAASLTSFPTLNQNTTGTSSNITGVLGASSFPAMTGDVTNTQGSLANAIASKAITLAKMADMATASFIGRNTALTGAPEILSATTAKSILAIGTGDVSGLGTIATQASSGVTLTGGTIDGITIGASTAGAGTFTTLTANTSIIRGSDTITDFTGNGLTLSTGALTLLTPTATDGLSSTTSNGSGLEVLSGGVTLLQGCADGQVLKWTESTDTWSCQNDATSAGGGVATIKEGGATMATSTSILNFAANDFVITDETGGQAGIAIDYTNSKITRTDQTQTITGAWAFGNDVTYNAQADVRFADSDSSNWVALQSAATVGTNVTWTLPGSDASGCFKSDGLGTMSISACGDTNTQTFNVAGTTSWTKPTGALMVIVDLIGGGGGGGQGGSAAAGVIRMGGAGGGGGAHVYKVFDGADLSNATETVVVAGGGTKGSTGVSGAIGQNGGSGGNSSFGTTVIVTAYGGGGGRGGAITAAAGGGGGGGGSGSAGGVGGTSGGAGGGPGASSLTANGGSGAIGAVTATNGGRAEWGGGGGGGHTNAPTGSGPGGTSLYGGGGGGGGGGITSANAAQVAGQGGNTNVWGTTGGGGAAGTSGATGTAGTAGAVGNTKKSGTGGGGGGASTGANTVGGIGGNGGAPGGAGGGGGGSTATAAGGAGGDGARGEVRVFTLRGSGADLAEMYDTNDLAIEPGDVVAIDSTLQTGVKKSEKAYDSKILGIVSTNPGLAIGESQGDGAKTVLVALAGRVPVKVSLENGPIVPGDLLTSSSVPGVAMKAIKSGIIVGQSLTSFDGTQPPYVVAFIKSSYANGSKLSEIPGLTLSDTDADKTIQQQTLAYLVTRKAELSNSDNVSEIYTDRVTAALEVITPKLYANEIEITGKSLFVGDVEFILTPMFNKDTAGFAMIKQGDTEVTIDFDKEYIVSPVVNASPLWDTDRSTLDVMKQLGTYILPKQDYIIVNANTKGFTLVLDKPASVDLKFSWMAIAVKDARTVLSASVTAPVPTPSPILAPTETPIPTPLVTPTATPEPTESPTLKNITIFSSELGYVRLRDIPSTDGVELDQIITGTILEYTNIENGWYQVTYNDKTGWVSGTYVSP